MNVSTNISHYETGNDMSRYHQQKNVKMLIQFAHIKMSKKRSQE